MTVLEAFATALAFWVAFWVLAWAMTKIAGSIDGDR